MTRLCIAGISGNVGSRVARAALEEEELEVVAGTARRVAGSPAAILLGDERAGFDVAVDVGGTLGTAYDVLVDYTHPSVVLANVETAIGAGRHVVIGTSGLSDSEYDRIDGLARDHDVGVFAAGNFSLTAALLKAFATKAAALLPTWEVLDYGPDTKPDAPSGTGRELANALSAVRRPRHAVDPLDGLGEREARGAVLDGTPVHSIRVPGYYSSVEVVFGQAGERLTLRHDSMSYDPYVSGTLLAVRRVAETAGLRRGLDTLLGIA